MAEKAKAYVTIQGRVQGVGFRHFTTQRARQFGLNGYVKNLVNGDVEVEIEGEKDKIKMMIDKLKKGPSMAYVDNLNVEWHEYNNEYSGFNVKF
jgi:acylphosphatase